MMRTIWSLNWSRSLYRSMKFIFLPTVLSASENFAWKSSSRVPRSLARTTPTAPATLSTSSVVLLTRTKKVTLMSARMLSEQIRPLAPWRSTSMVFSEMSMISTRWMIGMISAPVKVTSGSFFSLLTIIAKPWSTLR